MDRLERFYKIGQLLKERKLVRFSQFMEILGTSRAGVKRDLAYMRDRFNAPIEYDREANGYRFGAPRSGPRYELPGLWFNASEVLALLTTLRMLAPKQGRIGAGPGASTLGRGGARQFWPREIERDLRSVEPLYRRATELP